MSQQVSFGVRISACGDQDGGHVSDGGGSTSHGGASRGSWPVAVLVSGWPMHGAQRKGSAAQLAGSESWP